MVNRHWLFWLLGAAGVFACAPLIGLDDLHERAVGTTPADAGDGGATTCTSNAQCMDEAGAKPALCVSNRCVPIDTQVCYPQLLPSNDRLRNDNAVVFAAFVPLNGGAPLASSAGLAYALAVNEIDEAGGILVEPRRDVVMLFCKSEPADVEAAVRHVTRDLHVPAMLASFGSAETTRFVDDYARPAKVFTMNPNITAEGQKYRDVDRLVWNLLGPPEDVALAYRPLVARTEAFLRSPSRPFDAGAPLKVVLAATDTSLEQSLQTVIEVGPIDHDDPKGGRLGDKAIAFNDASVAGNAGNFVAVAIPATETGGNPDYEKLAGDIATARPDVVLLITQIEAETIIPRVEAKLTALGAPLPMWLLAPRNARFVQDILADGGSASFDEKRRRFVGIQYAGALDTTERDAWLTRMRVAYPDTDPAVYAATENFYDAVYWLAYGLGAAGPGAPANGESIRDGVRRLVSGSRVVHPGSKDSIAEAFRQIGLGEVEFVGALGAPDIDTAFGTWNSVGSVYCYRRDGVGAISPDYDVYRYDRDGGALVLRPDGGGCFTGF